MDYTSKRYKKPIDGLWLEIDQIVMTKLRMVGLVNAEYKEVSDLSGGMRKRVALARSIALDPEIFCLTSLIPTSKEIRNTDNPLARQFMNGELEGPFNVYY